MGRFLLADGQAETVQQMNYLYHSQTNLQLHYHAYNAPKQMFWTLQCLSTCTTTLLLHAYIVTWCKMPL